MKINRRKLISLLASLVCLMNGLSTSAMAEKREMQWTTVQQTLDCDGGTVEINAVSDPNIPETVCEWRTEGKVWTEEELRHIVSIVSPGDENMLSPVAHKGNIKKAIDTMGLMDVARMKVVKYSLGMRQRLGIAQAIMDDPPVLLLDEPMNGLDRDSVDHTYELLLCLRNIGKIILVASHHQQDIDRLCDQVYTMENGKLSEIYR